jgi:hypothetical protein
MSISCAYCTAFKKVFNKYFQTSVTPQQEPTLSRNHPSIVFGRTIVKLVDASSKRRSNEHVSEPRLKARRFESVRHDLSSDLGSKECNSIGSPLPSTSLTDDDDNTHALQQVSQLGLPGEDMPAHNMATSNQMNFGETASAQQQFGISGIASKPSSDGQHVENITTSTGAKILKRVPTVSSVGTLMESRSSGMAMTLNELSGTSNQNVMSAPSVDSAAPVIFQQPMQSTVNESQVYTSDSVYSLAAGKQDGLITDSSHSVNDLEYQTLMLLNKIIANSLQEVTHLRMQKQTPQSQPSQHEQVQQCQQHSSLENGETIVPSHAGVERPKNQDILKCPRPIFSSDNAQLKGSQNVLMTASNNIVPPQQQNGFPVNTSPTLVGKIGAKTIPVLQLCTTEARQIAAMLPTTQANTCQLYVSDAVEKSSRVGVNQEAGHLSSRYDCKNIY